MSAGLACIQLYDGTMLKKVNCTETVSLVPLPGLLEATETKTVSSLTLLRTLDVIPMDLGKTKMAFDVVDPVRSYHPFNVYFF